MDLSNLNDLDLGTGPVQKIVTCTIEGLVEMGDLELLLDPSRQSAIKTGQTLDIGKMRERHHTAARLVAAGAMTNRLIADIVGWTEAYLSTIKNSPAFAELVGYYKQLQGDKIDQVGERLRTVALSAVERLDDRLMADQLNNQDLLGLAKLGLDRSGHGPTSKQHVVTETHVLDHAELQRLNRQARRASEEDIVDAEVTEVEPLQLPMIDTGAANGDTGNNDADSGSVEP